jgi:hypothetical protein
LSLPDPVSTRNICDPDTAGLANALREAVAALQAIPVWFAGNVNPADSIGKDGDFYLNKLSGDIFQKEGGTWV